MNVVLLIVAILLGLLYVQAEINYRRTQRSIVTVLHQITSYMPFVIDTNTTVNELQHDLLGEPSTSHGLVIKPVDDGRIAFFGGEVTNQLDNSFDPHVQSMLHLIRGEN